MQTESVCEVLDGLKEGVTVVTTGGFMLESESQLQQPITQSLEPAATTSSMEHQDLAGSTQANHMEGNPEEANPQEVRIVVNGLFVPDVIHAKRGQTLKLNFYREEESGCINEVVFESLHIRRPLVSLKTTTVTLTPKAEREIVFMCGMGMVKGKIVVHN